MDMYTLIAKYLPVFTGSMLKFIIGPLAGVSIGLSYWETYICTVLGMMATVLIISIVGDPARTAINRLTERLFQKKRKIFTPGNRRVVRIWRKHGMSGVAFLTPLLLSPPFGTLIAVSFGERKVKIIGYMLVSALVWGAIFTGIIQAVGAAAFDTLLHGK